jgi:uncharacterized protein (DUF2249 family)
MNQTSDIIDLTHFDVREIPCREKHARIFARWAALPIGAHFVLVNDHDPVPLYYQFAGQFTGAFAWEYLVAGPDEFQVKITRLAASPASTAIAPPAFRGCQARMPAPTELDTRGLEPPEPLLRIIEAVEALEPGAVLLARTDRRPLHLYPELDARNIRHISEEQSDASWITKLQRV